MKKIFKFLLLAFVVLPCTFVFAACGGGNEMFAESKVDTTGNYESSTVSDYETFATSEGYSIELFQGTGIKFTYDISTEAYTNGAITIPASTVKAVVVCSINESGKASGLAMKFTSPEANFNAYAPNDGYSYISGKFSNVEIKGKEEIKNMAQIFSDWDLEPIDIEELLEELLSETGVSVKKCSQDTITKFELNYIDPITNFNQSKLNIVFENNSITGAIIETKLKVTGFTTNTKISIERYTGTITYPSDLASYPTLTK